MYLYLSKKLWQNIHDTKLTVQMTFKCTIQWHCATITARTCLSLLLSFSLNHLVIISNGKELFQMAKIPIMNGSPYLGAHACL